MGAEHISLQMLLELASVSYDPHQPSTSIGGQPGAYWLLDAIPLVVFTVLWAMVKPDLSGHRMVASWIVLGVSALFLMFGPPVGPAGALLGPLWLLAPLALIWFSEFFGSARGMIGNGGMVTADTPGWMVAGCGWIALMIGSGFLLFTCLESHQAATASSSTLEPESTPAPAIHQTVSTPIIPPTPATPAPLLSEVTLTAAIEMPISVHGKPSGSVSLQPGTRLPLISVDADSAVVRYLDSSATLPVTATDLHRASP